MIKEELVSMLKGEKSLKYTFWIYGVLIANVLFSAIDYGANYIEAINNSDYYVEIRTALTILLFAILTTVISIGVWKSANNYEGKKRWAISAKIFTVISILYGFYISYDEYKTFDNEYYYPEALEYVYNMNETLPKVSNDVKTEKLEFDTGEILTTKILLNTNVNDISTSTFYDNMKEILKEQLCNDKEVKALLEDYVHFKYIYKDKNKKEIATITIFSTTCEDKSKSK